MAPRIALSTFLVAACFGMPAAAQNALVAGNARAGLELASRSCASCHVVAANQPVPPIPNYGPNFADIASRPGITAATLADFLSKAHSGIKMPYADLTPAQVADVSAYILSLH